MCLNTDHYTRSILGAVRKALLPCSILASILTSCISAPDPGFFGDGLCSAPCWNGITPGITVERDAQSLVAGSPFVEPGSSSEVTHQDPRIHEYSFYLTKDSIVSFATFDAIVYRIYLNPAFNLQLGDLFERFGEPTHIYIEEVLGDLICYIVDLYYPDRGIMIRVLWCHELERYRDVPLGSLRLDRKHLVDSISYFEPAGTLEEALLSLWKGDEQKVSQVSANIQEWKGMVVYEAR